MCGQGRCASIRFATPDSSFRWINIFDKDDVLGWPLKPLSPGCAAIIEEDIAINSGTLLTSWNPASQTAYWSDDDFREPLVQAMERLPS